jgi:peptidoglycan hydrolase-like protein with peptidoglycan-binding domain
MRILAGWAALLAMILLTLAVHLAAAQAGKKTAAKKKAAPSNAAAKSPTAAKKSAAKSAATKKGKKSGRRTAVTWRNRQLAPSAERYREIQSALAARGYLQQHDVTGAWTESSTGALKRFQADQNLESTGRINSLSLIALGLGPKYEARAIPPAEPR